MWELADGESQLSPTLELPLTLRGHIYYVAHANVKHLGGYSVWEWDRDHNKANLLLFCVCYHKKDWTASRSRSALEPLLLQRISALQWTLPASLDLISPPLYLSLTISSLPMHLPPRTIT